MTPGFADCGGAGCWINESHANFMPHQLPEYRGDVHCSEMLANMPHLYYGSTRDRYCNWQFFEFLKDKHCYSALNEMWTETAPNGERDPWSKLARNMGWNMEQLNDAFGEWAMHNITWDYQNPPPTAGGNQDDTYRQEYALLTDTSASVRSIDRVEVMRGYLLAILLHREAAQVLLFDPSAGGTAPAERLADQQRRMVALLVGPRGTIDRQVRTRCAVAIAQLGAGELKGVPGHRLRKPLWDAAIDVLLGTDEPRIHVSEGGDATLDVRSSRSGAQIPAGSVLKQEP